MLLVMTPVLRWCHSQHLATDHTHRAPSVDRDTGPVPTTSFVVIMTVIFLICYSLNMIISELYITHNFYFVLIKVSRNAIICTHIMKIL